VARSVNQAVREICLSFPEAEEVVSHGFPDFRVRGKTFASYVVNHHGDGRVSLWLNAPSGAQDHYSKSEPKHFFVPPYVGPRGWLGVHLNKGLSWQRVASLVRQAYEKVAPPALSKSIGETIRIKLPVAALSAQEIDPFKSRRAKAVLAGVRKLVAKWPEVVERPAVRLAGLARGQEDVPVGACVSEPPAANLFLGRCGCARPDDRR